MHYDTLKGLFPRRRPPALVGDLSREADALGRPSRIFRGKYVTSGEPVELASSESPLTFLLSDISLRQWTEPTGQPSWVITGVGIPVGATVGCMFTGKSTEAFETDLLYADVGILEPDDRSIGKTCLVAVSKDADYFALNVYKSRLEIAELAKLIVAGCRVTVSADVECWLTHTSSYLPAPHRAESQGQVLIYCKPGLPSLQFSGDELDEFAANEGTDTKTALAAPPSGDIYAELKAINRHLTSFQQQLRQLWWTALWVVLILAAASAFSRWVG